MFAKPPGPSPLLTATPVLFSLALGDGHGRVISGGQRGLKGSEKCHGLWEGIAGSAFFPWLCLPQAPHRAGFVWPPPWSEAGRGQHGGSSRAECLPRPQRREKWLLSALWRAKSQDGGKTFGCGVFVPSCLPPPHSVRPHPSLSTACGPRSFRRHFRSLGMASSCLLVPAPPQERGSPPL